jgi:hypothetical protein
MTFFLLCPVCARLGESHHFEGEVPMVHGATRQCDGPRRIFWDRVTLPREWLEVLRARLRRALEEVEAMLE